jgi:hypothetical protein
MHLSLGSIKGVPTAKVWKTRREAHPNSSYAVEEIHSYIAIRDELLAEAEKIRTRAKLDTVTIANDFVADCLKRVRPPYEAQSLSEAEAVRERRRCAAVDNRLAELRASAV